MDTKIDLNGVTKWIELPDGYGRVWRGDLREGDLHLDCLAINDGKVEWLAASSILPKWCKAEAFALVIREEWFDDSSACPLCYARPADVGRKYCMDCEMFVIREMEGDGYLEERQKTRWRIND